MAFMVIAAVACVFRFRVTGNLAFFAGVASAFFVSTSSRARPAHFACVRQPDPVVAVNVLDKNGTTLGSQSGFFLDDRTLVTALHGVLVAETMTARMSTGSDIAVRSISIVDEQHDLALMSIDEQPGSPVFQVAENLPDVGDPVFVQSPGAADAHNAVPGRVICIREDLIAGLQIITSVEIDLGMSGSPALDANDCVVGVLTDAEDVDGRFLAQLTPSTAVTALARLRNDPLRNLSDHPRPTSESSRRAMLMFFMARDAGVAGNTSRQQYLLKQSAALAPAFWRARHELILSYLATQKYDEAADVLSTWVADDDVAYIRDYLQACTERLRGNPEASINHYEKSIERRPTVTALGELAAVYADLGRKDQAAALVAKAHALCPLDDRPLRVMYNTASSDGRLDDAVRAAENLVSRSWTSSARTLRARALMNSRLFVRAVDVLRTDVVEWPDEPELRTSLAAALMNLGNETEAIEVLEDCVKIAPSNPQTWFVLGSIYDVKKEGNRAIIAYEHARELNGTNPKILYNLGLAYVRERRMAEARETMEALRPIDAYRAKKLESLLDPRRDALDLQLQK